MKKTVLALFAVLLVLSLATCADDSAPPDKSGNTNMATLTVKVDNGVDTSTGRKITSTIGSTDADYFEVVFKSGTAYYGITWADSTGSGSSGSITIPEGNYTGAGNAVLFAGKDNTSEKTLLGVGIIYSVTDEDTTTTEGQTIKPTSKSVTFTVTSLTNDVNTTSSSTFKITGPTSPTNYATKTIEETGGSLTYPVFPVPGHC